MTDPTGSRSGSAAAIPVLTFTPDAVVVPLQYAVAVNRRWDAWFGKEIPSAAADGSTSAGMSRKSMTVASYVSTNPTATMNVAVSLRPSEREISMVFGPLTRWPGSTIGGTPGSVKGPNFPGTLL